MKSKFYKNNPLDQIWCFFNAYIVSDFMSCHQIAHIS